MKLILLLWVILYISVVYGSVSFRKIRSAQWQQPAQPYGGTNTWGGGQGNVPNYQRPPGYNNTGYGTATDRVPQHLPGSRPYPTFNQTRTPGLYQPTYNQSRPLDRPQYSHPSYPQQSTYNQSRPQSGQHSNQFQPPYQPRFGSGWNSTRNATTPRLYPDLSSRFGPGGVDPNVNPYSSYAGGGGQATPTPIQPYPPTGGAASYGTYNATRPNYPAYNSGNNPSYNSGQGSPTPVQPYPAYGGGANVNPSYGGGTSYGTHNASRPNYSTYNSGNNPTYNGGGSQGTNTPVQPYPAYGGGTNVNPSYGGGTSYGTYNATRANQPAYNPGGTSYYGGQQPNSGSNTWGHPNYQTPNATHSDSTNYYNPRIYA